MIRLLSGAVAVLVVSSTVHALPVPTNLTMRPARRAKWGAKVAQATPPPPDTPPPPPMEAAPPTAPTAPVPPAEPAPPAPPVEVSPSLAEEPELTPEQMAQLEAMADDGEVITITGSLIERKELTTPAPVSVIDKATIEASGLVTIGDVLQNLPSQSNAINTQFNNGGDGSTRVSLRGLGSARTLVLMNGRRMVPGGTGADASVDLNTIPLAVIERVEVLKDGASAVYGSEAIAGVVNIITRDDFDGQEATVYTGGTQRGDGFTYDVSFVTGTKTDKSSLIFSAGYMEQKPIFAGDRGFSEFDRELVWESGEKVDGGSTNTPYGFLITDEDGDGVPDPGNAEWDALVAACPSGACTRDGQDGPWRDFNFGGPGDPGDFYNFQPRNYLLTPLQRYNVFSKGKIELRKHMRAFFEATYMHRGSTQQLAPEPLPLDQLGLVISADNAYNPYGKDIGFYRRRLEELGDRTSEQTVDMFRVVTGLEGDAPEDIPLLANWRWELSFNYGRTAGNQIGRGNLILSRLQQAMGPSYMDAEGVAHCGTADAPVDGCVPINLLGGSGAISPDQIAGLTFTGVSGGINEQRTYLATARGPLLKMSNGGFLSLGVGADYREEKGSFDPDPLTSTGDTTGNATEPTGGGFDVVEGFGELAFVPLVEKGPAKWLELNAAARAVKYNTFGSNSTWKVGALFRTLGGVSLRGTYSTAFRAPSIGELYSGAVDDFASATDPCDTSSGPLSPTVAEQCAAEGVPAGYVNPATQLRAKVGGNPNLGPETADVFTGGIVIEPPPLEGFAITLDYFHIDIKDAIQAQGADVILANCYNTPEHTDCDKIIRFPGTNVIDYINDTVTNIGGNKTTGLDFALTQKLPVKRAGTFRFSFEGTYLLKYEETAADRTRTGLGNYDLGVFPRFKSNFTTVWGLGGLGAGMNLRYIGTYKECLDNDCNDNLPSRNVASNITTDLFGSYNFGSQAGKTTLSIGVNNVLDQDPPFLANGFLADSDASTYDYLGRYFYLRLSQLL